MATKTALVVPATATLLVLFLSFSMTASAVVDEDGNPINEQSQYYIRSVGRVFFGELGRFIKPYSEDECTLYVVGGLSEVYPREAVKLVVADKAQNQTMSSGISAGESVYYINSGIMNAPCRRHGYWYGGLDDELTGSLVVFGNGDIDQDSSIIKFTMEEAPYAIGPDIMAYKMYTCVSKLGQRICGYLAPFYSRHFDLYLLTITTSIFMPPLQVVFIKKDGQETPYAAAN